MKNKIHLKILEKRMEASGVVSLVLHPEDGYFSYKAGQFLTLLLPVNGKEVRRSYSLSSSPGVDPYPILTIKRKPNGRVSSYLVEEAAPGQTLTALLPAGQFTLPEPGKPPHHLFLIAGGSGITPVFSIIKYALACTSRFKVILLYANRNEETLIFRDELRHWLELYPNRFKAIYLLSNPVGEVPEIEEADRAQVLPSRLGNALLEELIKSNLPAESAVTDFYLCGPSGLLLKSEMALRFLGYPESRIHKEVFNITPPFRPASEQFSNAMATLKSNGTETAFPVKAGQTILEAAEQVGLELPYSCRSGICTSCSAYCREGEVAMSLPEGLVKSSATQGVVQTCVGYPLTKEVRIVLK